MKADSRTRITFDYNNCLAAVIKGGHGLAKAEIDFLARRTRAIAAKLAAERRAGKLPYRDLPYQNATVKAILKSAAAKRGRFDNVVVLGIGGSALGTIAVHQACGRPLHNLLAGRERRAPRLFVMDNIDPAHFGALVDLVDARRTLFVVISKSGTTAETMAQFLICRQMLIKQLGRRYAANVVAITDREKGYLREIAGREGYETFAVPQGVEGRYSVLSPVAMFPLAMVGVDVARLLAGARDMDLRCCAPQLRCNPAFMAAAIQYLFYQRGKPMSVMMPYSQALRDVADWYRQLWAESLGKMRRRAGRVEFIGPTPIKALGVTDQHSQVQLYREGPNDKVFTLLAVGDFGRDLAIPRAYRDLEGVGYLGGHTMAELMDKERRATSFALTKSRRPNATIKLPVVNEFTVGQLLYMLEVQTAFAGELFGVNPYDQPGVEEGKIATHALLGRRGKDFQKTRREINALKPRRRYVI
jgi:glucose-6-phosphate isomerase